MRQFLPIKGPGGRQLTTREKVALVVLSVTLILCVLTLLAGNDAFGSEPARNPIFSLVAAFARPIGIGILALYAAVLLWSGLIFFKGERAVSLSPLPARALAAFGAAIGISGLLGIARLDAAGELGHLVGGAVGSTFGAFGFLILLAMMALGAHLAGQGALTVLRGSAGGGAAAGMPQPNLGGAGGGFHLPTSSPRMGSAPMLPDDGDPSADERTLAITQAMEEIERRQGVRIVDVQEPEPVAVEEEVYEEQHEQEPEIEVLEEAVEETRTTIGEEVEALPEPTVETEEAQVQRCLDAVASALAGIDAPVAETQVDEPEPEIETRPAATLERPAHGYVSLLDSEQEEEAAEEEEVEEEADVEVFESDDEEEVDESEFVEYDDEEFEEEEEEDDVDEEEEVDEDEEEWEEDEEFDDDDDEEEEEEEDYEDEDDEEEADEEDSAPPQLVQPYLFPVAKREVDEEDSDEDGAEEGDPPADERETNFDWRGRPLS